MKFIAYDLSLDLLQLLRPILAAVKQQDPDLADQIRRAATSVTMNLAEGTGRSGKERAYHYRIARGSVLEVRGGLDAAEAWGYVEKDRAAEAWRLADRIAGMLWRLG